MEFLEKDLETIIFESDKDKLLQHGLNIHGKLFRQFRIANYGTSDLIEVSRPYYDKYLKVKIKGKITIYELKQNKLNIDTFMQALRYLKGIKSYLKMRGKDRLFDYEIVLIGKTVETKSSFIFLEELFWATDEQSIVELDSQISYSLYTYYYELDGLKFNSVYGYDLINKGF